MSADQTKGVPGLPTKVTPDQFVTAPQSPPGVLIDIDYSQAQVPGSNVAQPKQKK